MALQQLYGSCRNMFGGETILVKQIFIGSGFTEDVRPAYPLYWQRVVFTEHFGYSSAQTSNY